ncbi:MAG: acetyl-CoA carboxylase carboxyltransferase subunit alpha [Candidatus Omnitrophica bacterium]|nr:acetyl-CoA carboxylase carboxyltransferase subunit alpha [Candidatus Omnitrophota bacterium]MCB9747301.1 acetyl-CoA carboxylase carboxyltransferase subunit alpha [Candidatus Omnitrophota bacterium]
MGVLDFEKPIFELEAKINELRNFGSDKNIALDPEIRKLEEKLARMKGDIYSNLTAWQRIQIARHPDRPYTLDYIRMMCKDFVELHGDRQFADDFAFVAGFAQMDDLKVMIMGHQKGRDTNENVKRNFGCAHPEGYRKAMRLMDLGAKYNLPIVILIDTPGAYPGVGAEERGQAQAIASNLRDMTNLKTPVIATVIGEGGSGGALGVGVADRVLILQHAYYSVISPEGCASILWRNAVKAPDAAEALKINSEHLLKFGIVDEVIPEPMGGAHHDPVAVANHLKKEIIKFAKDLSKLSHQDLLEQRYQKYRKLGAFEGNEIIESPSVNEDESGSKDV